MPYTDKPELLLVFDPKTEREHYSTPRWTLDLTVDLLQMPDDQGGPYNLVRHPEYQDLQVRALASDDMSRRTYGWGVEFRGYQIIDLRRSEDQVRTLRKVQRALDKIPYRDWPGSFGEYLLIVAKTLGVKRFGYWTDRRPNGTRQLVLLDSAEHASAYANGLGARFFTEHPAKPREEDS